MTAARQTLIGVVAFAKTVLAILVEAGAAGLA